MQYQRMPIEIESPEQMGYHNIKYNLTESSFRDFIFSDLGFKLNDLVICYGDHQGLLPLRQLLSQDLQIKPEHILTTVGAASALFIAATTILQKGDRLLVVRPNYATNIETPRGIGAEVDFYDLTFENGFQIDPDEFVMRITEKTKLVSLTQPHNPTGAIIPEPTLKKIIDATERRGCLLLVDETYRELTFKSKMAVSASMAEHVISISSMSKAFGLPGIRLGWLIHQNAKRMEQFLAAKEQIFITGSIVDEEIALQFLKAKQLHFPRIQKSIQQNFEILKKWMLDEKRMEWIEPVGGVVAFPRIKKSAKIDVARFYKNLNDQQGTFVGPGHWFEQPKEYMRIGYAWPTSEELVGGLAGISRALDASAV